MARQARSTAAIGVWKAIASRRGILALAAALISLLLATTATASAVHAAPHKEHTLRVMSINIHHAADANDVLYPKRIARDIESPAPT